MPSSEDFEFVAEAFLVKLYKIIRGWQLNLILICWCLMRLVNSWRFATCVLISIHRSFGGDI